MYLLGMRYYAPKAAPIELQIMVFGMLFHSVKRSSRGLFVIRLLLFVSVFRHLSRHIRSGRR